jgi:alkylation response protein AidB-like acyl-CoA dehydrogenase
MSMNFGLSESQHILRDNARKFFTNECPIAEVRRIMESPDAYDAALYEKLAAQGFTGIIAPEEYGGLGLGKVEMVALLEEMGRALVPGPYFSSAILAGSVILEAGDDNQKRKYLTPIAEGDKRATLALVEAQGSWHPNSVQMTAHGTKLSGTKIFVTDAAVADTFIVVVRYHHDDLALFAVDAKAAGVTITPMPSLDLTRRVYSVQFNEADGELLAMGAHARSALHHALNIAEVALAAELTGGMQRTLDLTVEYAKTRKQFGKPIGGYQAVQHQCADMYFFTEGSRSSALYAAWALDNKAPDAEKAVAIAKMYASDSGREVGNRAIQVHGGMGFTWENDCHLYYRRAKASEVMLGDASYHRDRIAALIIDPVEVSSRTLEEAFALD